MRSGWRYLAVGAGLCVSASWLGAQGWIKMPNGSLAYAASYTTTGMFSCGNGRYIIGRCQSLGNSVVLTSPGNSTATITFTGVNQTFVAPSIPGRAPIISLGSLQTTFSGSGPHVFPTQWVYAARIFGLSIGMTITSPMVSTGSVSTGFASRRGGLIGYNTYHNTILFATAPSPPPSSYRTVALGRLSSTIITADEDPVTVTARVSATPEPATLALLGSGLLGVFGLARRRRLREG